MRKHSVTMSIQASLGSLAYIGAQKMEGEGETLVN